MEGNATAQKLSCGSKHSGSYISTEECANGNAPEEFKILGQSRRPSPLSSLRPRKHKYTHVKKVHRYFSSASSILRSLTVVNLWPSCVQIFHESCHIYIIVRSNIAALRSTRLSQGKVFRHFGHIYFDCLLNRKEYGHTYKWHFQIKHFASLLDFELFCCTGAASYYNSAIGLSNRPFLFFAA